MSLQSPRTWAVGGTLLALVLAVIGWYVAVAPLHAQAAEVRTQVVAAESAESVQQARLAELREDFVQLPERQNELAAVRESIPVALDLPALTRDLTAAADGAGVTLMGVSPSLPGAGAGATTAATTTDGTAATTDAAATTTAPTTSSPGVQTVGLQLTVIGSFSAAREFLRTVQGLDSPAVLVTGLTVTGQAPGEGGDGKPATVNGDVQLVIDAAAYILPSTAS